MQNAWGMLGASNSHLGSAAQEEDPIVMQEMPDSHGSEAVEEHSSGLHLEPAPTPSGNGYPAWGNSSAHAPGVEAASNGGDAAVWGAAHTQADTLDAHSRSLQDGAAPMDPSTLTHEEPEHLIPSLGMGHQAAKTLQNKVSARAQLDTPMLWAHLPWCMPTQ